MVRTSCMLLVGLTCLVSQAFAHTEHNSFLETPVFSVDGLLRELKSNATVATRYERQFKMSETDLERYFSTLHVAPLSESNVYLVFNVDDSLVIRARKLHLTQGTLVFVDPSGKPILKRSCGNPLVAAIPARGSHATKTHSEAPEQDELKADEGDSANFGKPGGPAEEAPNSSTLASLEPALPAEDLIADQAGAAQGGRAMTLNPVTSPTSPLSADFAPSGTLPSVGGVGGLGYFGALVALGGAITGHGNNTGLTPAATPEPSTWLAIACGLGMLSLRRRRR